MIYHSVATIDFPIVYFTKCSMGKSLEGLYMGLSSTSSSVRYKSSFDVLLSIEALHIGRDRVDIDT